ncbi:MAG: 2-C-methyl-D-erythritol 4-phosphate cytidylyltransferase [Acidimicrobiales bacterium]
MGADAPGDAATDTWAVVVAAGDGARFGGRKQFAEVAGRPVVSMAVKAARSVASGVVVVIPPSSTEDEIEMLGDADKVVPGGPTRAASVRAGLEVVPDDVAFVVVHDAARPLATWRLFEAVVRAVRDGADAAVPGLRVSDTLKRVDGDVVVSTVSREDLVAVQTPQAFRAELLRRAHAGEPDATDDAALVEGFGAVVRVVQGERSNIKLTEPGDLRLIEALMTGLVR